MATGEHVKRAGGSHRQLREHTRKLSRDEMARRLQDAALSVIRAEQAST